MTHDPIDLQAAIREAAQHISTEARAAIDLYVLEQGPLRLEREGWGYKFVARQEVRLRLKEAEEIRADERERAAERVAALNLNSHYRIECEPPDPVDWSKHVGKCDAIAEVFTAIRGEV